MAGPQKETGEIEASYESIDERDLLFRAWTYMGRRVRLAGQVTSLSRSSEGTWMTLRIGSFPHWVIMIVRYVQSLPELRQGMMATVYGLCAGTERVRYESPDIIGLTVRRPLIRAEYVGYAAAGEPG
ncbi:MAG: hypothetical protein ACE5I0_09350 [Candidatus Binatia bacterium]